MSRIKNFLTPQWLKEFEEMKRQAASSKRKVSSIKRQAADESSKRPAPSTLVQDSSRKHQAS